MKDIDFDELDRAVSSLMGTVPKDGSSAPAKDDKKETAAQNNPSSGGTPASDLATGGDGSDSPEALAAPAADNQETKAPDTDSQRQPKTAPAARRGRYMDVVRPTAKSMHKSASSPAVSRQAPTIQPIDTPGADAPAASEPASAAPQPNEEIMPSAAPANGSADQPADDTKNAETETPDDFTPLSSPFLPGAKVEKRPLGRPAGSAPSADTAGMEEIEQLPTMSDLSDFPSDKDAQLPEQPLPAELDSELLSIETSTEYLPPEAQASAPDPAPDPDPAPVAEEKAPTPAPVPSETAPEPPRATAVTSIPQQYKVKPSKTDDESPASAIYDAQPLSHPAEKKSGWLWVVAIIGIILLGVAGGVAVYYLDLI